MMLIVFLTGTLVNNDLTSKEQTLYLSGYIIFT